MLLQHLTSALGKTYLSTHHTPPQTWIYADWQGYPTVLNVLTGARAYLDDMQRLGLRAVLNDNRHLVGRWDASLEFLEQQWIPYAVQTGLRYWAHLDTPGSFSAESAAALRGLIKGRFEVELFEDELRAQAWLRQKTATRSAS